MSSNTSFNEIRAAMILSQLGMASRKQALAQIAEGYRPADILENWEGEGQIEIKQVLEKFNPENEIEKASKLRIEIIPVSDIRYPELLRRIDDAPLILYARGKMEMVHDLSIAVVGARHASFYGTEQARRFARVLSDAGLTIVSGMALGIDQAAHEAALQGSGRTVAVLGCGIDVIYPDENEALYHRIAEQGLILSEYSLGSEPRAYHFPRRNRILSGLSLGVFVVEAHERSGSLITAYQALEQGREVFAMPGPVHHITSRGTHRLIREGAALVESPEEILMALADCPQLSECRAAKQEREFDFSPIVTPEKGVTQTEAAVLENADQEKVVRLLKGQNRDYEGLFELSGMAPNAFARVMTELEVEGKIRKNLAGYYELG